MNDFAVYKKECNAVRNRLEFYAMRRSGHHAVMEWIFSCIDQPVFFENDIFAYAGCPSEYDGAKWVGSPQPSLNNNICDWHAFNAEDISLLDIGGLKAKNPSMFCMPKATEERSVLVLRDPFNMFASRYRLFKRVNSIRRLDGHSELTPSDPTSAGIEISWYGNCAASRWKQHAREFLDITNILQNKVCINYNRWFQSREYRRSIALDLGIKFSDAKLNFVPNYGLGSSFDVRARNGEAQKMGVLSRWEGYKRDNLFKEIFVDEELISLSLKIFPDITEAVTKTFGMHNG